MTTVQCVDCGNVQETFANFMFKCKKCLKIQDVNNALKDKIIISHSSENKKSDEINANVLIPKISKKESEGEDLDNSLSKDDSINSKSSPDPHKQEFEAEEKDISKENVNFKCGECGEIFNPSQNGFICLSCNTDWENEIRELEENEN